MVGLAGKVALLTGASSGVGGAIAFALAAQGARLCVVGRNVDGLTAVAARARKMTSQVLQYSIDLTVERDLCDVAERIYRDFGAMDILVHSAGTISLGPVESSAVGDLDRQYQTNVRAPYILTQKLLPMLKTSQGQIVFINSSLGLNSRANVGTYAATKHALKALADSLRDEVNPYGVRVLSVFLGRTATPMQAAIHDAEGTEYRPERLLQPDDVAAVVTNALGLPRTAEVTDISIRPLLKP
jgi:NADP-dependent 3-hydroxy acid dehydrogenase YdfG